MDRELNKRIYVAGHRGLVGSSILRALRRRGYTNLVTYTHAQLDLTDQTQVRTMFRSEMIDEVYLAAATVGGIYANSTYPADFMYSNMAIESNVIHEAWRHGIQKLLFLGSSCIYPRLAPQPIPESALLTGPLEPTNEPYAVAKIAGIKLCESYNRQHRASFRSVMPTNLYGPGDNYHPENSHVVPGLIRRLHDAKLSGASEVVVWGSGRAQREFLYVDDLASACLHVMNLSNTVYQGATRPMMSHINVGSGVEISIAQLAHRLAQIIGYQGNIVFDASKPDGTPRKLLDRSCLTALGWQAEVGLEQGLRETYNSFCRAEQIGGRQAPARALDRKSQARRQAFVDNALAIHAYQDMRSPF
jgi:GDP-L-fucose synthase